MILDVVKKIEKRGALEIAHKVLQRITAIFRYAVQTGKATFNPASDMKGVLKSRKVQHMTALGREDLLNFSGRYQLVISILPQNLLCNLQF